MTHYIVAVALLCFPNILYATAEGFLKQDPRAHPIMDSNERQHRFNEAMSSVMGCSSSGKQEMANLSKVEEALAPMWAVLPKSDEGLVDWKILRYLTHRYFMQQSSLLIRGLEPTRRMNESDAVVADVLKQDSFSFVESALAGKRATGGFTLKDSAALVASLERVIYDSESVLLEQSLVRKLKRFRRAENELFERHEFYLLIETYMVHWLSGGDDYVADAVLRNRTLMTEVFPYFDSISRFIDGVIRNLEYFRARSSKSGDGNTVMSRRFSFDDAHNVVGDITRGFASFWESECQTIKESLVAMDRSGTGRVRLSDFYGANVDGDWRFGESEQYLRDLGAIDETSPQHGSQVIITNYLLGASNCIVSTNNYFVCCVNECEAVLNDIEVAVGEPVAWPEDILRSLSGITNFDDDALRISTAMTAQLQRIADTHSGKVPLHGRLFAQWLHFAMPHECPFPHKVGTYASTASPNGDSSHLASQSEIFYHADKRGLEVSVEMAEMEEAQMMSQWSDEEELLADYSLHMQRPWELSPTGAKLSFIVLLAIGATVAFGGGRKSGENSATIFIQTCSKAHFV